MPETNAQSPPKIHAKIEDLARALAREAARRDYMAEQELRGKQSCEPRSTPDILQKCKAIAR